MIRNNQNGRRRGRGGARPAQGGGPSGNYGNNNGGGSRIDNRQRGNAAQLLEKYKAMARDATQNGDRVQAEFYMQYADHYFRVLSEFRARDPQPAPRSTYDDDDDGYGGQVGQNYAPASERDDDGDEDDGDRPAWRGNGAREPYAGQREAAGERRDDSRDRRPTEARQGDDRANDGRQNDGRQNDGRQNEARQNDGRQNDGRQYDGRQNDSRQSDARQNDGRQSDSRQGDGRQRDDRPREEGRARDDARPRDDGRSRRGGDYVRREAPREVEADAAPIGIPGPATLVAPEPALTPSAADSVEASAELLPVKRPRGRPRKVVVAENADG